MSHTIRIAPLARLAAILLLLAPAAGATTYTLTVEGTMGGFRDTSGAFGPAGTIYHGLPVTAAVTFDGSQMQGDTVSTLQQNLYNYTKPAGVSLSITINGLTFSSAGFPTSSYTDWLVVGDWLHQSRLGNDISSCPDCTSGPYDQIYADITAVAADGENLRAQFYVISTTNDFLASASLGANVTYTPSAAAGDTQNLYFALTGPDATFGYSDAGCTTCMNSIALSSDAPIPEPATAAILATAIFALTRAGRRSHFWKNSTQKTL